ncbi:AMP-binding protein [Nocardiopsis kunsanensis]|uniref:AMP-binding protein n=1 Tax=Nocardiopsis kunsanensis TaxID=141693 RepID=UPI000A04E462|nr:class I adenylate-forming enzyme family protein [Nocardiopsis kunsanensis]
MFDLAALLPSAATKHPGSLFILDAPMEIAPRYGGSLSYRQMNEVVEATAVYLASQGVNKKDIVAVYKRQNPDILPLACAIARVGAIPAMISPELGSKEAAELVARLAPKFLITSEGMSVEHPRTVLAGEIAEGTSDRAASRSRLPSAPKPKAEEVYLITHTSGTTDLPKLVPQARRGTQMPITVQSAFAKALGIRETFALAMSFVHGRTFAAFATALRLGINVVLVSDPEADNALPLLAEQRPGLLETHPNMAMSWYYSRASVLS